ncbi:HTH_Tnp_Tc3_2 domain-containing protein [Trichonephila clavipes]|nr:HTH_Tnp_Tc3_2 domain-containing protein [Trichonephila clavipes]
MGSRRETSIYVRKFIISLFKKGKSYREIAKIVGRSHSCVQKIIGRFRSDGLIENKSGRGRKSILSDVAKRKVLKDIKIDPKLSAVKLAAETSRIMGRSVSAETVRNVIRHAVYSSLVARKKPFINLQNQKKRLEFAKTHQLKTFGRKLYLVTKVNSTFLEVMAIAPFGESHEHRFGSKKFTSYSKFVSSGFQMLNDDEIVTSVQEESDPVDDETDEDEDNNNN